MRARRWICGAVSAAAVAILAIGMRAKDEVGVRSMTLNSMDYRLSIYELANGRHGESRQVDDQVREYLGDVLFDGENLVILESDTHTGLFIDLGEERRPDTEFSFFHALRVHKRSFQMPHFPFRDRYVHYDGIDPNAFFTHRRDAVRSVKPTLGHTYLVRIHHRTALNEERMYILRVIELTPGVTFTALYRELVNVREP
jgi:hypothetical protein